jgi:formamidopyrimidine-DNA glycosylase
MPELPEVETVRRQLDPLVVGATIVAAGGHPSAKFAEAVEAAGSQITAVRRRGKYLLFELDDDRELIIHLGMTGRLGLGAPAGDDPYLRAWWDLDDGATLRLDDVRRFGRVKVVPSGEYSELATLATIGPEPLSADFTAAGLYESIRSSDRMVKTQLLSQRPVAGVGNIYADEALWRARVLPRRRRVGQARCADLWEAIRAVLSDALDHGGTTLRDYRNAEGGTGGHQYHLDCYGRAGEPCNRCADELLATVIDNRTTTYCSTCQT